MEEAFPIQDRRFRVMIGDTIIYAKMELLQNGCVHISFQGRPHQTHNNRHRSWWPRLVASEEEAHYSWNNMCRYIQQSQEFNKVSLEFVLDVVIPPALLSLLVQAAQQNRGIHSMALCDDFDLMDYLEESERSPTFVDFGQYSAYFVTHE